MITRSRLLKAAALVSSILLVAGFVSYRAGAFNWLMPRDPASTGDPTFIGSSKSIVLKPGETPTTIKIDPKSPAFMSSSKSIILVEPGKDSAPTVVPNVPVSAPSTK